MMMNKMFIIVEILYLYSYLHVALLLVIYLFFFLHHILVRKTYTLLVAKFVYNQPEDHLLKNTFMLVLK